jgi:outer membrane protein assembly factor BamB
MSMDKLVDALKDPADVRNGVLAIGVVLAAISLVGLLAKLLGKKRRKRPELIALVVIMLLGSGIAIASRFVLYRLPGGGFALRPLSPGPDEQINEAALEQLKTASLEGVAKASAPTRTWPQWRGPNRDGISAETDLNVNWTADPPPVLWKQRIGRGYSSPAIIAGRLYVTDFDEPTKKERVLCLDSATGKTLWTHAYEAGESIPGGYTGPRATPTVEDSMVYSVGHAGQFFCLGTEPKSSYHSPTQTKADPKNPSDGKALVFWEHDLLMEYLAKIPQWGVACSPLLDGGRVIVQFGDADTGLVAAFDARTGKEIWKGLPGPSGYSSPVVATIAGIRQIVVFNGVGADGLRVEDGERLWSFSWPTDYSANIASPVVAGDYVFLSSSYNAGCALIHVSKGIGGGLSAEPVYIKRNKLMRNHHSTCVLHDGYLYGCDSGNGQLKCVNLRTSEDMWTSDHLAKNCAIYAQGHLIVLAEDGNVVLVEATPQGYHRKCALTSLLQGPECWALPALADGRLYVRDHHDIVCVDLRLKKARGGNQ